jgi:tetratricopeptide (TPR) repeat protein
MQTESSEVGLPKARMAVLRENETKPVAIISLTGQIDGSVNLTISGDENNTQLVTTIAKEVSDSLPKDEQSLEERFVRFNIAIRDRFLRDGFQVESLPESDIQLKVEFDLKTGRLIGRRNVLHEYSEIDDTISNNIQKALSEVFTRGPEELTAEIESKVAVNDMAGAGEAIKAGRQSMGFFGVLPSKLLDALIKVRVDDLDTETCKDVRECRMAVSIKLKQFNVAEEDASALLAGGVITDKSVRASLENVIAIAAAQRGEIETALSIWRELLKTPEVLDPLDRGWVWRNFSMSLTEQSSEAIRAAKYSIDAFLEGGDKREAATSLMHLSGLLESESPNSAIEQLDNMLMIITENGLLGEELRASIHHSRGRKLLEIRNHPEALKAALKAIEMRRGVAGVEEAFISSLHLAAIAAKSCGKSELENQLNIEAEELERATSSSHFKIARRIADLLTNFDQQIADDVFEEALRNGNGEVIASAGVAIAMSTPDLTTTTRLRRLEALLLDLGNRRSSAEAKSVVWLAIASVLRQDGQFKRSIKWLRHILASNPLSLTARELLIDSYWKDEDWGAAAIFLKEQIDLYGEAPGLLYAYGRSLVEAGDASTAISVLMKALKLVKDGEPLRENIMALRERALEIGGTLVEETPHLDKEKPVLCDEVELALQDFSAFIAADKRMVFWERPNPSGDYVWVKNPERRSQDLLHTFFKARFQTRISIFEELDTGAGRLDLLLKLEGGLSVIIELKMCGFGYASTYAASGEGQIIHYMESRATHLGYLVVLDSRLENYASQLISNDSGKYTVREVFIDVRPRVSVKKKSTKRGN